MFRSSSSRPHGALALLGLVLAGLHGCGGGTGIDSTGNKTYALGGTVVGLGVGSQVVLLSGAGTQATITANGGFRFPGGLAENTKYAVSVFAQPAGQTCTLSQETGTVAKTDVTTVQVGCRDARYAISGSLTGLPSGLSVTLSDGPQSTLVVSSNGTFVMPVRRNELDKYNVTVTSQSPGVTCTVSKATGDVAKADVSDIGVTCATATLAVAGTVTGLAIGSPLTLRLNDTTALDVTGNGNFAFPATVKYGGSFAVTVAAQPNGQTCTVSNGSGINLSANVTQVQVTCSALRYAVGGQVVGLTSAGSGATLLLRNNGADDFTVPSTGPFTFPTPVAHGAAYSVTVGRQPAGQTCSVSDGSASAISSVVTSVRVQCLGYVWRTGLMAGTGTAGGVDGAGLQASFNAPVALAMDPWSRLLVADMGASRIRRVDLPQGVVSTIAGTPVPGFADSAVGLAASFHGPSGVAVDAQGNVYIADTANHAIRRISVLDGSVSTVAGSGQAGAVDGTGSAARFNSPRGLALDRDGTLIVADTGNHVLRRVTPQGVVTRLAGVFGSRGRTDGPSNSALFNGPTAVAVDAAGTIYVADTQNSLIRALTVSGAGGTAGAASASVVTVAGGDSSGSQDGEGAFASFLQPMGIAVDPTGTLYVADTGNHLIRQVQMTGTVGSVLTIAGSGRAGRNEGVGVQAEFSSPSGILVSPSGVLYLTELGGQRIRFLFRASN